MIPKIAKSNMYRFKYDVGYFETGNFVCVGTIWEAIRFWFLYLFDGDELKENEDTK